MNYRLIFLLYIIIYCYYLIFYIDNSRVYRYNTIKKVLLNRSLLFLITIFIIFGLFGLYNKTLTLITNVLSFVIPVSLIMIEI
jgi:hypothetical protein